MSGRRLKTGLQRADEPGKCEKNVKIGGTNSASALESAKASKNELKTNWFLSAKKAKRTPKSGRKSAYCAPLNPNFGRNA
jgi:hypothetical protein